MNPMIVLPPDAMSEEDIKTLRANDICVVVAKDPAAVKFVDTVPEIVSRTAVENAAIQLSRRILTPLNAGGPYDENTRGSFSKMFVDLLMKGTPLDPRPSRVEQEQQLFDRTKAEEIQRLAREEARQERAAAKAAKAAKK